MIRPPPRSPLFPSTPLFRSVTAGELGCVVPHGTGTDLNDRVESSAIGQVLGGRTGRVPLYSLKALIGHTGGAAGDRKSTRLNSSHSQISYAVFCLKKKK